MERAPPDWGAMAGPIPRRARSIENRPAPVSTSAPPANGLP